MKEKIMAMTNDHGRKFMAWFREQEIIGIERTKSNVSRREFTVIYRYPDGSVCTAILPDAGTENNGCCFFGELDHFARCYAADETGCRMNYYGPKDWPMFERDFSAWNKYYSEMIRKYS